MGTTYTSRTWPTLLLCALWSGLNAQEHALAEARTARDAGRHREAIVWYTAWLADRPDDLAALRERAEVHAWSGHTNAAVADYEEVLQHEPENLQAMTGMGYALAWAGEHTRARRHFQQVLARDSSQLDARKGMAYSALWAGLCADAEQRFRQLLSERPDLEYLIALGDAARCAGNPERARSWYQQAKDRDPSSPQPAGRLDALERDAADLEVDLLAGPAHTEELSSNGFRMVQVARHFDPDWKAFVRFDRSLGMENTDLLRQGAAGSVITGGAFHRWHPRTGTLLELSHRQVEGAAAQLAILGEQVFYLRKSRTLKGGVQTAWGGDQPEQWLLYTGLGFRTWNWLVLEPMYLLTLPQPQVLDQRFLLTAKVLPGRGYELALGLLAGTLRMPQEGGPPWRTSMTGIQFQGLLPISRPLWLLVNARLENGYFNDLSSFSAGVRLRFNASGKSSLH